MSHVDPRVLEVATDREKRIVAALEQHGTHRAAAEALDCSPSNISDALDKLKKRAAKQGIAPGHFTSGVAPGNRMGKVTVQRNALGEVERTWERQHPDGFDIEAAVARCEERLKDFPRFAPTPAPSTDARASALTNFLGLFDLHIGESISSDDPAGRWNIEIATRTVRASIEDAFARAPKAKRLVLCFGGDAAHYDSLKPVTPRSKHVLNADGDAMDMIDAVLDLAFYAVDRALETHEEVHLVWAAGNHDEFGALWVPKMIARVYRDEPRLKVVQSRAPYYALLFGKVMLCIHHGQGSKLTELAGKFAAMFRSMWGQAEYAYAHAGHQHHIHEKEKDGLLATQHPSLAPSDDYAMSKGLVSRRGCMMVTYHDDYGEVDRRTTRPEMLGVFDEPSPAGVGRLGLR
jgi:hypothetical protein